MAKNIVHNLSPCPNWWKFNKPIEPSLVPIIYNSQLQIDTRFIYEQN